jgi:5-methylcytosine-specific restriction endonuclease McrA
MRSDLPQYCGRCKLVDKRVLAVHHKDKNRENNALSNLMWLCHNCHYLVHHDKSEAVGFVVPVA